MRNPAAREFAREFLLFRVVDRPKAARVPEGVGADRQGGTHHPVDVARVVVSPASREHAGQQTIRQQPMEADAHHEGSKNRGMGTAGRLKRPIGILESGADEPHAGLREFEHQPFERIALEELGIRVEEVKDVASGRARTLVVPFRETEVLLKTGLPGHGLRVDRGR